MSKYQPLGDYLASQTADEVAVSFDDIERITGVRLPAKAQQQRAWWSNNPANNVMTRVWLDAGFRTERVDVARRQLVFRRARPPEGRVASGHSIGEPTVMYEVNTRKPTPGSGGRSPLFGWLKGYVQVEPGTDLAKPADPEWVERLDADTSPFTA